MDLPTNYFKAAIKSDQHQLGFWCSLPGGYAAEIAAGAGYDWLLFDTEHSPSDPIDVLAQLQAAAAYDVSAIVRPASNDPVLIKRMLDVGAQTLLVPYVQSREEAEAAVAAMRYPPRGIRGVSGLTRATRFGRIQRYATRAESELCLLVQVETGSALDRLEAIASVEGVDGVFIGPADLAASLGFPGEPDRPEVVAAVEDAILRIRSLGKPAGILTPNPGFARRCIELGSVFTAVGIDAGILARGSDELAKSFRQMENVNKTDHRLGK